MRKCVTIVLLTFSLIFPQFLFANESDPLSRFHLDVDLKLKLFSTLIQVNQQLSQAHQQLESQNLSPSDFERQFKDQFKLMTEEYIQTQLIHTNASAEQKNSVAKVLLNVNWSRLSKVFLSTYQSMRLFTRTHGIGLMTALIMANIVQYSIGYLLVLAGQPVIALTFTQIPSPPPTVFVHHVISNSILRKKMSAILGGPEAYDEYKKMKKEILQHLHLHHSQDVFVPLRAGESNAVVINQSTTFTKVAQQFNLAKDKLTVTSLRSFLRKHQIEDSAVTTILQNSSISEYARMMMAITYMSDQFSADQFAAFKHQFSKNFVTLSTVDQNLESLHDWIKQAVTAKSKNDLEFIIRHPPNTVHPQHVFETWEKIILPELARGSQLGYQDIRLLATRFHSIKIENELRTEPISYRLMRETLNDYFRSSLNSRSTQCFRSQQEIIVQLLKDH